MKIQSSEAVRIGHPDKLADLIADSILDEHLRQDPHARVACEVLLKGNVVVVSGEISSSAECSFEKIIRNVLEKVGYTDERWGIGADTCSVYSFISEQSTEIAQSLKQNKMLAAGDQTVVWGYATNESKEYLPLPYVLAQKLAKTLSIKCPFSFLRPDGKIICSMEYENNNPSCINSMAISVQHDDTISTKELSQILLKYLQSFFSSFIRENTKFYINPSGAFHLGGPLADTGLTGRKIMVDTYGTLGPHGGGSFSGKDSTKVDRYGAYIARYIAKNIVASGICSKCSVQIVYVIGMFEPVEIHIETFPAKDTRELIQIVKKNFPLYPNDIIETFKMRRPIYQELSFGGHFGRDYPWENLDKLKCFA